MRLPAMTFTALLVLAQPSLGQSVLEVPAVFPTIQSAIDAAVDGDLVRVAAGVYPETIDLSGKLITLAAVDGPGATVVDAQGAGTTVVCATGETAATVIEGFTFRGGLGAVGLEGGGMRILDASPTVRRCVFSENDAGVGAGGGGLYIGGSTSAAFFTDCVFSENDAGSAARRGGGIYLAEGNATLVGCTLMNNGALDGGGLCAETPSFGFLIDTRFVGNQVSAPAGRGAAAYIAGTYTFSNCLIASNLAVASGGAALGPGDGVGVFVYGQDGPAFLALEVCTIVDNASSSGLGIALRSEAMGGDDNVLVERSIIWDNGGGEPIELDPNSPSLVENSCVQGGFAGFSNFESDPLFVSGPGGDYYLSQIDAGQPADSPCLDFGPPQAVSLCSPFAGLGCLSDRTTRVDEAPDVGPVDVGFHYPSAPFRRGDCNNDQTVDVSDAIFTLATLFITGAPAPACEDACDLNDDGQTDISDAVYVLQNLFAGGAEPPAPFPNCGGDPTPDFLECDGAPCF
ncbi:MAG: right-handed parallel beta-helix repeat-containing protein [Planctomycetota bacterium]